ncbi:trypsin-like serine protease [Kitasatospora purpeofusca]|uniref:trypsin-like serine protease n=1 Tax=Kitasatospora purpeofusca TaxID=67352 RepID=UPI00324B05E1
MHTVRRLSPFIGAALAIPLLAAGLVSTAAPASAAPVPTASGSGAPALVENYVHPGAASILADRHITVRSGDGHIQLVDCAAGSNLLRLYSRAATPSETCFRITGPTGSLQLEIPKVYSIKGDADHSVTATFTSDGNPVYVGVPKNTWTQVGEGNPGGSSTTLLELNAWAGPAVPVEPLPAAIAKVTIGRPGFGARSCTGSFVDQAWILTAASCFAGVTAPVGRTRVITPNQNVGVDQIVPHGERDLVMLRLATPIPSTFTLQVGTAAATAGSRATYVGLGRSATDWMPSKAHESWHTVTAVGGTTVDTVPVGTGAAAPLCLGDAGAPLIRDTEDWYELFAIASGSWQAGCVGVPPSETRSGVTATRVDDVAGWVQQLRATTPGRKLQTLVTSGNGLFHATRLSDGAWTPYEDVQAQAGDIGGIRTMGTADVRGTTHVVALGGDGRLHHTARALDGSWSAFTDVNRDAGNLTGVTRIAVAAVGDDIQVVVLAGGLLYESLRYTSGGGWWAGFSAVLPGAGALTDITALAVAGDGTTTHIAVSAGGHVHVTSLDQNGAVGPWSSVEAQAGSPGRVTSLAVASQQDGLNLAVVTDTGAQFRTLRSPGGTWQPFRSLAGVFPQIRATSISAATTAPDEAFLTITTTDNRVLLTHRYSGSAEWGTATPVNLTGVPGGDHTGTAVTGSH